MVEKFRVPRKDPSIASLFQDDSKWRTVALLPQDDRMMKIGYPRDTRVGAF